MKAVIQAHNNPDYAAIYQDIKAIVFIGKPHRGADLAKKLNLILTISFSARSFVNELRPDSHALKGINRDFIYRAPELKLISFFETESYRWNKVYSAHFPH